LSNLITRILVAAVAIPIILWISYQGGWWLFGMLALFMVLGAFEFLKAEGWRLKNIESWIFIITLSSVYFTSSNIANKSLINIGTGLDVSTTSISVLFVLLFFLLTGMLMSTRGRPVEELFSGLTRLFWGLFYLSVLYSIVFLVGSGQTNSISSAVSGGDYLLFLFAVLWVGDTAAMGFGKWIGKHKLAPIVSPNKTVEGFFGGIIGALMIGVLMIFWRFESIPWHHVMTIAAGCSVFGQLGDLTESLWKRSLGIKDSSAIIPGHGGVLDRFDSLLFGAPFMYLYISFFRL